MNHELWIIELRMKAQAIQNTVDQWPSQCYEYSAPLVNVWHTYVNIFAYWEITDISCQPTVFTGNWCSGNLRCVIKYNPGK